MTHLRTILIPCDAAVPMRELRFPLETTDEAMCDHFRKVFRENIHTDEKEEVRLDFQALLASSRVHNVPTVPMLVTHWNPSPAKINVRAAGLAIAYSDDYEGVRVPRGDIIVVGVNNLPRDMHLTGETKYKTPPHGSYLFLVNAPSGDELPVTTYA